MADIITEHREDRDDREHREVDLEAVNIEEYMSYIAQNQNIFLYSPGGCGKSYVLKLLYKYISENCPHIRVALTSSTGISAVNIGGVTLHHYTGIGLGQNDVFSLVKHIKKDKRKVARWRSIDYLFIDEISMLGGSLLDKLNEIGKMIRGSSEPFGGIKFFVSGDALQLPSINDYWFFQSDVWNDLEFLIVRNFIPYRYPDMKWFKMLMRIRVGKMTKSDIKKMRERVIHEPKEHTTILYSKNKDVIYENCLQLNKLTTPIVSFLCIDFVAEKQKIKNKTAPSFVLSDDKRFISYTKMMDESVPQKLDLKEGAECIVTFNIDVANGIANGTRCVIEKIFTPTVPNAKFKSVEDITPVNCGGVNVRLTNTNEIHYINFTAFSLEDDDYTYFRYQIPLKIAYALTIHKSQSLSLDSLCTSIGTDIFCAGQAYVALSRCKRLENLYLLDFDPKKIIIDEDALEFERMVSE